MGASRSHSFQSSVGCSCASRVSTCSSDIYNTINPGRKLGEHFEFVQSAADPAMMSFDTPLGHRLNMWVTVQATAELSRMVSVTNQSLTYTEALGKKSPAILSLYIGAEA